MHFRLPHLLLIMFVLIRYGISDSLVHRDSGMHVRLIHLSLTMYMLIRICISDTMCKGVGNACPTPSPITDYVQANPAMHFRLHQHISDTVHANPAMHIRLHRHLPNTWVHAYIYICICPNQSALSVQHLYPHTVILPTPTPTALPKGGIPVPDNTPTLTLTTWGLPWPAPRYSVALPGVLRLQGSEKRREIRYGGERENSRSYSRTNLTNTG